MREMSAVKDTLADVPVQDLRAVFDYGGLCKTALVKKARGCLRPANAIDIMSQLSSRVLNAMRPTCVAKQAARPRSQKCIVVQWADAKQHCEYRFMLHGRTFLRIRLW